MDINSDDDRIQYLSNLIVHRTKDIEELHDYTFKINVQENFEDFPRYKNEVAFYCQRTEKIIINYSIFYNYETNTKLVVVLHEIAHAFIHRTNQELLRDYLNGTLNEEYLADYFVCLWGFFNELSNDRRIRGKEYCQCLTYWNNRDRFSRCMSEWNQDKHTGIIK